MNANNIRYVKQSPLFKKSELIISIALYIILIGAIVFMLTGSKNGETVRVYSDGELVWENALDHDDVFVIEGKCTVIVSEGYVYVCDSTCANKLCEKCGKIRRVDQSIICIPNNVIVRISGEGGEVDAVT